MTRIIPPSHHLRRHSPNGATTRQGGAPAVRSDSGAVQPRPAVADDGPAAEETVRPNAALRVLAATRIALGLLFLWAFADKTFGLEYATASDNAWIDGGSPTRGFLSGVAVGPFESMFNDMAGNALVDWLFMLGLLGIGIALVTGIALRLMAVAGVAMMALMWAAEWPLARTDSAGELTRSTNPVIEYHVLYAMVMVVVAMVAGAGSTWGLADRWRRLPVVANHPTLW